MSRVGASDAAQFNVRVFNDPSQSTGDTPATPTDENSRVAATVDMSVSGDTVTLQIRTPEPDSRTSRLQLTKAQATEFFNSDGADIAGLPAGAAEELRSELGLADAGQATTLLNQIRGSADLASGDWSRTGSGIVTTERGTAAAGAGGALGVPSGQSLSRNWSARRSQQTEGPVAQLQQALNIADGDGLFGEQTRTALAEHFTDHPEAYAAYYSALPVAGREGMPTPEAFAASDPGTRLSDFLLEMDGVRVHTFNVGAALDALAPPTTTPAASTALADPAAPADPAVGAAVTGAGAGAAARVPLPTPQQLAAANAFASSDLAVPANAEQMLTFVQGMTDAQYTAFVATLPEDVQAQMPAVDARSAEGVELPTDDLRAPIAGAYGEIAGAHLNVLQRAVDAPPGEAQAGRQQVFENVRERVATNLGQVIEGGDTAAANAFLSGLARTADTAGTDANEGMRLAGEIAGRAGIDDDMARQLAGTADEGSFWDKFVDFLLEMITLGFADTDTFNGDDQLRNGEEAVALGKNPEFLAGLASQPGAVTQMATALASGHTTEGDEQAIMTLGGAMLANPEIRAQLEENGQLEGLQGTVNDQFNSMSLDEQLAHVGTLAESGDADQVSYAAGLLAQVQLPEDASSGDRIAFADAGLGLARQLETAAGAAELSAGVNSALIRATPAPTGEALAQLEQRAEDAQLRADSLRAQSIELTGAATTQLSEAAKFDADGVSAVIHAHRAEAGPQAAGQLGFAVLQGTSDEANDNLARALIGGVEGADAAAFTWGMVGDRQNDGSFTLNRESLDAVGDMLLDGAVTDADRQAYATLISSLLATTNSNGIAIYVTNAERAAIGESVAGQIADGVGLWADDDFVSTLRTTLGDEQFLQLAASDPAVATRFIDALEGGNTTDAERETLGDLYAMRYVQRELANNPSATAGQMQSGFQDSASPNFGPIDERSGISTERFEFLRGLLAPPAAEAPAAPIIDASVDVADAEEPESIA